MEKYFRRPRIAALGALFFRHRSFLPFFPVLFIPFDQGAIHRVGGSDLADRFFELLCFFVAAAGMGIRVYCVGHSRRGTSGRNRKTQVADSLNTDGLYSVMRHPIYAANLVYFLGFLLMSQSWNVILFAAVFYGLFYWPIIVEEDDFLAKSFPKEFSLYSKKVSVLLPSPGNWRPPLVRFNMKRILVREADTFVGLVCGFGVMHEWRRFVLERRFRFDPWTLVFFAGGVGLWMVLKYHKKRLKMSDRAE